MNGYKKDDPVFQGDPRYLRQLAYVADAEHSRQKAERLKSARDALESELRGMFEGYTGYAISELIDRFDEYLDARAEAAE